jgi:hypothetical protein
MQESEREVSTAEGEAFARRNGCLFVETSAKMDVAVAQAFEELVLKVSRFSRTKGWVGYIAWRLALRLPLRAWVSKT